MEMLGGGGKHGTDLIGAQGDDEIHCLNVNVAYALGILGMLPALNT
jgi:hypothetical protein